LPKFILIDPANKAVYEKNATKYISKLNELDKKMKNILKGLKTKTFIIYHPAFGYFADDYNLKMLAIEKEGKRLQSKIWKNCSILPKKIISK